MESHELYLGERTREKDLKAQESKRTPRNNQRLVPLTNELVLAMQDVQWRIPPIEYELECVKKFSLVDCIRAEVTDLLNKLPKISCEFICRDEIEGLIRRNLLKERKVRFAKDNDVEGEPKKLVNLAEAEKNSALEEMDIILQVLGNDKNNKLIIENFELLEKRITRVEQRLSGLIRKVPELNQAYQAEMKIDIERVKVDLQKFVDTFNNIYSSPYDVEPCRRNYGTTENLISSTNRLKLHLLARLSDQKNIRASSKDRSMSVETKEITEIEEKSEISATKSKKGRGKRGLSRKESKTDLRALKAVDSLIALRERFQMQSVKWKKIKIDKTAKLKEKIREDKIEKARENLSIMVREIQEMDSVSTKKDSFRRYFKTPRNSTTSQKITTNDTAAVSTKKLLNMPVSPNLEEHNEKVTKHSKKFTELTQKKESTKSKKKLSSKRQKSTSESSSQEPKELVLQYINKKVLKAPNLPTETKGPTSADNSKEGKNKENVKPEALEDTNVNYDQTNYIDLKNFSFKAELNRRIQQRQEMLKAENEKNKSNQKQYKKIFLFKLPKSKNNKNAPKKSISNTSDFTATESVPDCVKPPSKLSKRASKCIFNLTSKTMGSSDAKADKSSKERTKSTISMGSLFKSSKKATRQKFKSKWIYPDGEKPDSENANQNDPWTVPTPLLNSSKDRKTTQKVKKKKTG